MNKPNIIFLHVDQLNRRSVGAWGGTEGNVQTPNLDRLAGMGTVFETCYVTVPQCLPCRTSWYTGLSPEQSGVTFNGTRVHLPTDLPDLGSQLKAAGYDSVYMGKWHVPRPVEHTFDVRHAGSKLGELSDAAVARTTEAFIAHRKPEDGPFFLNIGLTNPHDICYWNREPLGPQKTPIIPLLDEELPLLPPNHRSVSGSRSADQPDWSDLYWRFYSYSYYRFVEMVDAEIGRIIDAVQHSRFTDNTVIVFASDHGQGNGEHMRLTKNTLYEHGVNVPLIICAPGSLPGRCDSSTLVSGLDIPATICDYAGADLMPECRGRSLRPIVEGRSPEGWRDYVTASTAQLKSHMIRKGDMKLICDRESGLYELYDLARDPWEITNLADRPDAAETVKRMETLLVQHRSTFHSIL